jgi:ferredoxin-fold anticodon binding domain-containing protein
MQGRFQCFRVCSVELLNDDELERMWKEMVVHYFHVLSQNLSGGSEESHKELPSG